MATITKRKNNLYTIRAYLGKDLNGKKLFKTTSWRAPAGKSEKAILKLVNKFALDFEEKIKKGEFIDNENITLNEFYKIWRDTLAPKYLTQRVIEDYSSAIEKNFLMILGNKKISSITTLQLQAILNDLEKRVSPTTARKYFNYLSSVFRCALEMRVIEKNAIKGVIFTKNKKHDRNINFFNETQVSQFLAYLRARYDKAINTKNKDISKNTTLAPHTTNKEEFSSLQFLALFYLAIYGGFRKGELLALSWHDIDFKNQIIDINKSLSNTKKEGHIKKDPKTFSSYRKVKLPSICFDILESWQDLQKKQCINFANKWEGASLLIAGGVDIETIAKRLGHSNISTTLNIYGHALPSQEEKAVIVLETMLDLNQEKPKEYIYKLKPKEEIEEIEKLS